MSKIIFSGVGIVVLLWLGIFVFSLGVIRIPDFKQNSLDATVKVQGGQRIKQQIFINDPNFSSLGISLMNRGLLNKKDLELIIWEDKIQLRTVVINGEFIQDGKFLRFDFNPIPDSVGKVYTLEFSAPSATDFDGLEIFLTKEQNPQAGLLLVNELPYPEYNSIAFVSFHKPESRLTALGMIMNDFSRRLAGDPGFLAGLAAIVGLLLFVGFSRKFDKYFKIFN